MQRPCAGMGTAEGHVAEYGPLRTWPGREEEEEGEEKEGEEGTAMRDRESEVVSQCDESE